MSAPSREEIIENIEKEVAIHIALAKPILEQNLYKFATKVLEVEKGKDRLALGQVHKELCFFIDQDKKRKKLVLIPRGHLKSTIITIGRSLQAICANPNVRILIGNATYALACSFLTEIKRHLKFNEKIKLMWGDLSANAEKWSENQISIDRGSDITGKKEPTVTAMGVESNLTSQHYDIIILDDLVNKDYVNSADQILKTVDFYKECLNLLEPGGELILVGTRWDDKDLYGWIMDPDNQAIGDFEVFLREAFSGSLDGDDFVALYPEKFSQKYLQNLRAQQGPYVFANQYQNRPISKEDADFKEEWFHEYDPTDVKGRPLNIFTMVDPAISLEKDADFTAMITVGVDDLSDVYILDIQRGKWTPQEVITRIFDIARMYHPLKIGIEDVAFQRSLQYSIHEEMKTRDEYLPIFPIRPQNRTKDQRIRGLQPLYANGKIKHNPGLEHMKAFEDELLRFPRGKHDDMIDACSYLLDMMFPAKRKVGEHRKNHYLYA